MEKSSEEINEDYAKEYLAKSRSESDPGLVDPAFLDKAKAELNSGSEELSEEAKAKLKQEQLEEEGRRIASQWTSDPDAASVRVHRLSISSWCVRIVSLAIKEHCIVCLCYLPSFQCLP